MVAHPEISSAIQDGGDRRGMHFIMCRPSVLKGRTSFSAEERLEGLNGEREPLIQCGRASITSLLGRGVFGLMARIGKIA